LPKRALKLIEDVIDQKIKSKFLSTVNVRTDMAVDYRNQMTCYGDNEAILGRRHYAS